MNINRLLNEVHVDLSSVPPKPWSLNGIVQTKENSWKLCEQLSNYINPAIEEMTPFVFDDFFVTSLKDFIYILDKHRLDLEEKLIILYYNRHHPEEDDGNIFKKYLEFTNLSIDKKIDALNIHEYRSNRNLLLLLK